MSTLLLEGRYRLAKWKEMKPNPFTSPAILSFPVLSLRPSPDKRPSKTSMMSWVPTAVCE